jgi:DnaJ-class molecular chaperone
MDYTSDCEHCNGSGVLQSGSLKGNYCQQCVGGQVLTQDGIALAALIDKHLKELTQ